MTETAALDVFYGEDLIGTVFDTEPLSFEYAQVWLNGAMVETACAISGGRFTCGATSFNWPCAISACRSARCALHRSIAER